MKLNRRNFIKISGATADMDNGECWIYKALMRSLGLLYHENPL